MSGHFKPLPPFSLPSFPFPFPQTVGSIVIIKEIGAGDGFTCLVEMCYVPRNNILRYALGRITLDVITASYVTDFTMVGHIAMV